MWTVRAGFLANGCLVVVDEGGESTDDVAKLLHDGEAYNKNAENFFCFRFECKINEINSNLFYTLTVFLSSFCFEFECSDL